MAHGAESKSAPPRRPPPRKPILGPPAPPDPNFGGGGTFPRRGYKPIVPAHDKPPIQDARQAPYAYVLGHPGERSHITPAQQIDLAKSTQHGKLTPKQTANLALFLRRVPHPVERLTEISRAQQAGVLPPQVLGAAADTLNAATRQIAGLPISLPRKANIIAGFPRLDQPSNPAVTAELEAAARARGVKLPANPTLTDLYQAKYGSKPGWSGIFENLPRDFALTPLYAAEGGYALGDAAVRALPKGTPLLQGRGDVRPLEEVAAQQVDVLQHPGAFVQEHPFQAGLAAIGGLKAGGRAGAIGRDLEATPRSVPLLDPETRLPLPSIGGEVPTLERGTLSTRNLTTRGAQKLSDEILARNARLQGRAVAATLRDARAEARAVVQQEANQALKPFMEARGRVSRKDAQRTLENEARGITPAQHAAFRGQQDPGLPPPTPAQEALHAAGLGVENAQVARLKNLGLLSDFSAQRRAYHPAIQVAAAAGDTNAARFLHLDTEVNDLYAQLKAIDHPDAASLRAQMDAMRKGGEPPQADPATLQTQLQAASTARDVALQTFARQHDLSGAPTPLRVPEVEPKRVQSKRANPGGGMGLAAASRRTHGYTGALFRKGTYKPVTDEAFLRDYAVPSRVEQAYRFAHEVSNPKRGLVKEIGPNEPIPDGYVLQRVRSHENPLADELAATSGAAPPTTPLKSLMSTFDRDASKTPNNPRGTYRLWPTSVWQQLDQMTSLNPPTGRGAIAATAAGRYLRNALLYSRPAYPLTNMVGNMAQSALVAGNIPFGPSYQDALKRSGLAVPPRIEGTGTAAVNFDAIGSGSLRNAWADRGSTAGGVARVALHPIARYTQGLYQASVAIEDWTRRATYLAKAVPGARRIAHPDAGLVRRFALSFRTADAAVKDVLQQMADGTTPETAAAAERAVKVVHQALGDFAGMGEHRTLSVAVPFWRWTNFVRILMGQTLPVHYPGRALLLYRLGALGQAAQHQMGNLTPSLQGSIPSGLSGAFTTQAVNPFATLGQDVLPTQGSTSLNTSAAIGNLTPFGQIAYEMITGHDPQTQSLLLNQRGEGIAGADPSRGIGQSPDPLDRLRLLGAQGVGLVPLSRGLAPLFGGGQANAPATSIDLPGLVQRGPKRSTPQQPPQGPLASILNQISPVKYRSVDLQLMAKQGSKKLHAGLLATRKAERRSAIESTARRIAAQRHIDITNRNDPRTTDVLLAAIDEYERSKR